MSSAALVSCSVVRSSGFVQVNVCMFTCVEVLSRSRVDASRAMSTSLACLPKTSTTLESRQHPPTNNMRRSFIIVNTTSWPISVRKETIQSTCARESSAISRASASVKLLMKRVLTAALPVLIRYYSILFAPARCFLSPFITNHHRPSPSISVHDRPCNNSVRTVMRLSPPVTVRTIMGWQIRLSAVSNTFEFRCAAPHTPSTMRGLPRPLDLAGRLYIENIISCLL